MEDSTPAAPRRVGRYVLVEALGAGGMGAVYRALDPLLDRHVALKLLLPSSDQDEATRAEWSARMLREARAAAALTHPNVVTVYDVGVEAGAPFIAMELVHGKPLRAFIGDASVSLGQRVRWLVEVARALAAAHRAGIVHRDVKPENVVVAEGGVVKVLDFGIARMVATATLATASGAPLGTLTAEGMILGTPQYMAPEQIRSEPVDGRTDQFAWGVVAFELLTGRPLWPTTTEPLRVIASILTSAPPPARTVAPAVPGPVSDVIERALSKRAADRFPTMDAAADALQAAAGTPSVQLAAASPAALVAPASSATGEAPPAADMAPRTARTHDPAIASRSQGIAVLAVAGAALVCGAVGGVAVLERTVRPKEAARAERTTSPGPAAGSAAGRLPRTEAAAALAQGRALLAAGQVAEAMRAFDRAVLADPGSRDARASLNRLRADSHHFLVKGDGTVVETIAEVLHGAPDAPWELTTDTGLLTRAWDFEGNALAVERVSAAGDQATFRVTGAGPAPAGSAPDTPRGIVYELESSSKDKRSAGLSVLFHAVAKNTSGETTFIVQLPAGTRALSVVPTPSETREDDSGTVLVLHEARSAFVPYAWSVVHARDPAVVERFQDDAPVDRERWITAADPRMARHGWASDLARASDLSGVCRLARTGALDTAKTALAKVRDAGPFFAAREAFCVATAEHDERGAAAALEAALSASDRPDPLVPETYGEAIDWCLDRKRVSDMARLVRLEHRNAPWWNDGPFHVRLGAGDPEPALRAILAREPNNVAAAYDLALALYRDKRFEDAAHALEGADAFLGGIYVADLRARIAVARGEPGDAAAALRKVVTYYPMTWAWIAHAVLLASARRQDEAFAFIGSQAPGSEYQPPFFWALRYVVGVLPHASRYTDAIVDLVGHAKESQYGEAYRLERMVDLIEVASLSLDPDGLALSRALFDRFKGMLRDTSPETCNESCLHRIGAHLCRARGLGPADRAWIAQTAGGACP